MKHIKVRAELLPSGTEAMLTIIKQTHEGRNFACTEIGNNCTGFVYEGVALVSSMYPEYRPVFTYENYANGWDFVEPVDLIVFVIGNSSSSDHMRIPAEAWPRIKAAIEQYNGCFA